MDKFKYKRVIMQVIELIKDNKTILEKIKKEDYEVIPFDVDIDKIIHILKENTEKEIFDLSSESVLIEHYGDPYFTTLLCIEALTYQNSITIGIEDLCLGINKAIVKIFNDVFKDNKLEIEITLKNNISISEIQNYNFDKIVCLGNTNAYSNLSKVSGIVVKNVPLFSVALYYDSDEFYDLVEKIVDYCDRNYYEIEVFDNDDEFEDSIYMINNINLYCSVILSKDENKQKSFKKEIQSEIVCVNENPFKRFKYDISGKIF